MRFSCDSCSAQYMISDDKVGPNGVKVRCKKCGHIVLVKRPPSEAVEPAPAPPPAAPPAGDAGLDAELGQAFDAMFGEGKPEPKAEASGDVDATQVASQEDLARLAAGGVMNEARPPASGVAGAGAEPVEWYVAVDDQQVGPLASAAVRGKWESGEIGPDSLVWRSGMEDWKALSTVPDLADMLAPVPRPQLRPKTEAAAPAGQAPPRGSAPAAGEPSWKPNAAGALAALVSEEIASLSQPEPKNGAPAAAARPAAAKGSLIDSMNLPDAGGVDPTGAIPLTIKGLEASAERELKRTSSVARSTAALRGRRSATRTVAIAASAVALVAVAGAGVFFYSTRKVESPGPAAAPGQATAPVIPAPAAPAPASPQAAPPLAAPAPQAAAPAAPAVGAAAPAAPAPQAQAPSKPVLAEPALAPPAGSAGEVERPASRKSSRPEPATKQPPRKRGQRVAAAEQAEAPPAPEPPKKRKSTGDPLLDFAGDADSDFERELGGSSGKKRSVYVPPAPGSELPGEVSQAQIQEGVASRMSGLRDCLTKQEAADPGSHGVLKLRWIIAADGSVSGVRTLTPEFAKQPIAQCLTGVVKTIRFPRSRTTGQEVIFPFKF